MKNLNSFQQWALSYLAESGYTARPYGNWIMVELDHGTPISPVEIMSVDGVLRFCEDD